MAKKIYTKIHKNPSVAKIHIQKIKKRGGKILSSDKVHGGTMLKYYFI